MANSISSGLEATAQLAGFFGTRAEVLKSISSSDAMGSTELTNLELAIVNQVLPLFDGSTPGGASVADIQSAILDILAGVEGDEDEKLISKTFGIFHDDANDILKCPVTPSKALFEAAETKEMILAEGSSPTKATPGIAAIQVFPANLQFSNSNASRLQVFLNFIPTLEMSRCVPYFDMKVISGQGAVVDGRATGLSQIKFLMPNETVSERFNVELAGGYSETDESGESTNLTLAGMELFTSPQTLVNSDDTYFEPIVGDDSGGLESFAIPILDQFRPFMTIKEFSVSVVPAYGAAGYKTGKLSLVLHDRSRLGQIAQFVQPDLYGNTELLIEWGWSHPDAENDPGNNPLGEFLNDLRRSEKFGIRNSSYTFTQNGQVDINLEIVTKGGIDHESAMISNGGGTNDEIEEITKIMKQASEAYEKITKNSLNKDIIGTSIIRAATSTSFALNIDDKTKKEINDFISKNKNSSNELLAGLVSKLHSIYGTTGKDGLVSEVRKSLKDAIDSKNKILENRIDPFASPFPMTGRPAAPNAPTLKPIGPGFNSKDTVSLGKLLMVYVGKAFASKNKYDEVQFIFYGFNDKASYFRHHNISQFPINIPYLKEEITARAGEDNDMSVNQFIDLVNDSFIENRMYEPWGLEDILGTLMEVKKKDGVEERDSNGKLVYEYKENVSDDIKANLDNKITEAVRKAYPEGSDIVLKMPKLEIRYDTASGLVKNDDGTFVPDESKTFLRIYVYDKNASALTPQETLWSLVGQNPAAGNFEPEIVGSEDSTGPYGNQDFPTNHDRFLVQAMTDAEAAGVVKKNAVEVCLEPTDGKSTPAQIVHEYWAVNGHLGRLREYIRARSTSTIVGAAGSPIIAANLSSIHDPGLSTIKMKQFANSTAGSVVGGSDYGIPTMIQPAELSVEMIGNPLMNFTEKIFFDFNTSTNADAFYSVNGIEHKITNNSFTTQLKMIQDWSFEQFRSPTTVIKRSLERGVGALKGTSIDGIDGDGCLVVKVEGADVENVKNNGVSPTETYVWIQVRSADSIGAALSGYNTDFFNPAADAAGAVEYYTVVENKKITMDEFKEQVNSTYFPIKGETIPVSLGIGTFNAPLAGIEWTTSIDEYLTGFGTSEG